MNNELVNRNSMLNFIKGLACIGVVFIHIAFPGKVGMLILNLSDYAVPVFFMIAGFYSYGKGESVIKKRLIKITKIFLIAYTVFFAENVLIALKDHYLSDWLSYNFNIKTPIYYIVFCTIPFAIPLWYLIAQIETYIFWIFVTRKNGQRIITRLLPVLFVLQIILTIYCETKGLAWLWKINFVTKALPWFVFGFYINSISKEVIKKIDYKILVAGTITGAIIVCMPTFFDLRIKYGCIGYIPYAISIFIFGIKYSDKSISKVIECLGDKLSVWVYILHVPISDALEKVSERILKIDIGGKKYLWIHPVNTVIITIAVAFAINYFMQKRNEVKKLENRNVRFH